MSKIDFERAGFGTTIIHAGHEADGLYNPLTTPIYQTSTFAFESVEAGADIFSAKTPGFAYSRSANPTVAALEAKIAALEGAEACIATASGMGAVGGVLLGTLKGGDHLICAESLYSCTDVICRHLLGNYGVEVSFIDTTDLKAVEAAIRPNTKVIYFETLANPTMKLTNIAEISKLAHAHGITVVADSTFTPPPQLRPLKEGADIVLHSCTKYINGHGDLIAGAIVGSNDLLLPIRRNITNKICGTTPSPFNAFLILRGLQTLELRMARHCENGLAVAKYLESRPEVKKVYYPGLESFEQHEEAKKVLHGLYGGIMSFELNENVNGLDSFTACKKVLNALKVVTIAVSLGNPETLIQHPASMTHSDMSAEERLAAGVTDNLIRLSLGLENKEDIIADFEQAFASLYA